MRFPTKFISVCLVAALIVAACSSGDSDSSAEDTTTTLAPATTTASPPTTSTTAPPTTTTEAAPPSTTTTTSSPATTTSTTTSTVPEPFPAAQVQVKVFNGSGVAGAAGRLTARITESGYARLTPANAPRSYSSSVIYYASSEYSANARQLLDDVDLASATIAGLLPDPSPVDAGQANLIVIIGRDELADSLAPPAAEQGAETPEASSDRATETTTTTTTPRTTTLFPTATTVVPETSPEVTTPPSTQAPSTDSEGGPPPVPAINFGDLEALETPNISVVVRDGADEGGRLRYQVRRGSELNIEVVSRVGNGTVRVQGYGVSDTTSLFAGAWLSFTANRSGVFNISFTPDSTGEEEIIFQIEVS